MKETLPRRSWTFSLWLAFQEQRRDAVGELARAVARDTTWPGWRTREGLERYGREQGFSPALLDALRIAWDEWQAARQ